MPNPGFAGSVALEAPESAAARDVGSLSLPMPYLGFGGRLGPGPASSAGMGGPLGSLRGDCGGAGGVGFQAQIRPAVGNACQEQEDWLLSDDDEEVLPLAARIGMRGNPPAAAAVDDREVAQLMEMGFTPKQALKVMTHICWIGLIGMLGWGFRVGQHAPAMKPPACLP
jgi:hypothetical protein